MREGGNKKHLRKKYSKPIFLKVTKGNKIKKTLDKFSRKVNEDDQIKTTFDLFEFFFIRVTKKQAKKT